MAQKHPYGLYAVLVGVLFWQAFRKPKVTTIVIGQVPNTNTKPVEFPGYSILNCKNISFTNAEKAYSYAYNMGVTSDPNAIFVKLFGADHCSESISYRNISEAQFVLNLLTYFMAGSVYAKRVTLDSSVVAVNGARDDIAQGGFNLSPITVSNIQGIIAKYQGK